jgi:hypothetical protein
MTGKAFEKLLRKAAHGLHFERHQSEFFHVCSTAEPWAHDVLRRIPSSGWSSGVSQKRLRDHKRQSLLQKE